MTARPVPSRERVLRALFWKLLFRGRAVADAAQRRRGRMGLGLTLLAYLLFGLLPALAAFSLEPLAFASSLHAVTLVFASLTLATTAGSMLFVREEAEILLHRPVRPEELLRAKMAVLVAFSLLLALALNAGGLVTSFWNKGNAVWFPVAHALSTMLLLVLSAAVVVLVYNLCLRWFGRERFENLLALVQTAMTIALIGASQVMPRLLDDELLRHLDLSRGWAMLLPPVWFGALDALLCGAAPFGQVWLPAAIGIGVTALVGWLAFARLASAYGRGLLALEESAGDVPERPRRRALTALVRLWPLCRWLRDPVERQAFLLTSAYLVRDRETKLKLYPSLAPLVVMPLVMGLGTSGRHEQTRFVMDGFVLGYAAIVPIQAMMLLQRSEQWRSADLFRVVPLPHWAPVFQGARKAALCWLAFPALLLAAGVLGAMRGSGQPLLLILPAMVAVMVGSSVPGLVETWLPLSKPPDLQREAGLGCLVPLIVLFAAAGLSVLGGWLRMIGWFWPFLAIAAAIGLMLQWVFAGWIRRRKWLPAQA